ncbi:MAG TPA: NAD(P)H-dependent oxidoreductase [Geminicoccaceae bacterium]|nr:NAD(P)H-dependent oxidoreductase [Geminicoccaceae bacterium]
MAAPARLLAFSGSARTGSINQKLARAAAAAARAHGAEVTLADLRDFPMPLYDGDLEAGEGMPEGAFRFRALMAAHDGFLIASPEYNSSFTPLLKNMLDWASRKHPSDTGPLPAFRGKVAGLMSASNGRLGGIRGLPHLRQVLTTLGVLVAAEQLALPGAGEAFAEDGSLKDATFAKTLDSLAASVVRLAVALKG